ncbi:MAG: hypothetical protein JNL38_06540 [Myxococcales bacterium]|jgi:hypothetical protein|nr:hypothetical protein [Myxococcales bacterium]
MTAATRDPRRPLPSPSKTRAAVAPFPGAPPALAIRVGLRARSLLRRLTDRLSPPELVVFDRATAIAEGALFGAIARADVADLLEERGPLDAAAVAEARGLDADATHRALRALAASGVFTLRADGRFENNRLSRALRSGTDERTREMAIYFTSPSNAEAWLACAHTLETGESSFEHVHGKTVWEWFDAHPDEREIFAHAMMGITRVDAPVVARLYPFEDVARVCDVGGGRGTLLSEILKRHAHLRGVLCDAAGVCESARQLLAERGVAHRVELAPGSFFERVPSGADLYVLKNILHDWDDDTCRVILRVVRRAMQPGQRLLVCESLVEKNSRDPLGTRADLQMMMVCRGRERSRAELHELFEATGFAPARTFPFPTVSLVEAVAR